MFGVLDGVTPNTNDRNWAALARPWVFEPLARIGDHGEIVPLLGARVDILGPTRVRVWVRSDIRFEDGSPITFEDVAKSVALNHLRATRAEGEGIDIESLERGVPPEVLLARTPIFRTVGDRVFGAGPFIIREQDSRHIVLQRRAAAPRRIARIVLQSYATPTDAFVHTLKGDADLLSDVEPRWVEFFEGVPRLRVVRATGTHANIIAFNVVRLSRGERLALSHALANEDVRRQAFGDTCIAPNARLKFETLPSGGALEIVAIPLFERFALAVRRTLGRRGGEVRIVELESYFDAIRKGDFDLAAARPQISPPSMAALIWRTGATLNVLGYSNAQVDAALDARDWAAAQRALDHDPPAAFVCTPPNIMVVDSRIKNPSSPVDVPQWEVEQ